MNKKYTISPQPHQQYCPIAQMHDGRCGVLGAGVGALHGGGTVPAMARAGQEAEQRANIYLGNVYVLILIFIIKRSKLLKATWL